ncbi:MAG: MATE family efflux transporter [Firmicutes bacterium]|nr:MATE family efflux transporter [Bacillota bacterium]
MSNDRIYILEKMPIQKAIIKLAVPTMLGMIIQALYNLADTFFIGKLNDPNAVAAITISFPVFMVINALGSLFSVGGASYISRALGRKDLENASKAASIAFFFAIASGVLMATLALLNLEKLLIYTGAKNETLMLAKSYLVYIIVFTPFMLLHVSLSGTLRSEGASKEATIGMVAGTIVNILLDPIFILVFKMGVQGAAIATVIGNLAGLLYYAVYFLKKRSSITISVRNFSFDQEIILEIAKIGLPVALNQVLTSFVSAYANSVAASYGEKVIASMGIVMRSSSIAFMLIFGLSMGYQPIAGFCYGGKLYKRLMKGFKTTIISGSILSLFFAVSFFAFAPLIIKAFINNAEVIMLGTRIMRAFTLPMPLMSLQMTIMASFQAMGKGLQSMIISLGRQGLFFLPTLIILNKLFQLNGFIYAQPAADFFTTFLSLVLFSFVWKDLRQQSVAEAKYQLQASRIN